MRIAYLVLTLATSLMLTFGHGATAQTSGTFAATGNLNFARISHSATPLGNGEVLIAGGEGSGAKILASAELYNPSTGTFSLTGSMKVARYGHTATQLPNGQVLIAGGYDGQHYLASAELYDPTTGMFTLTGNMSRPRMGDTATLLQSGLVLIAGGASGGIDNTAELYDPAAGSFTLTGNMNDYRVGAQATLLQDGKVLIGGDTIGGLPNTNADLYDPPSGTFTLIQGMSSSLFVRSAGLLQSGMVFSTGGLGSGDGGQLYDPTTEKFTLATGSIGFNQSMQGSTGVVVQNGLFFVAGLTYIGNNPVSGYLYNPATESFTQTGTNSQVSSQTATLLQNGLVLLAGGTGPTDPTASAELFSPPALTSLSLASSRNPSTYGQKVIFSGHVTPTGPTGTVTLYDGSTVLGTATVSNYPWLYVSTLTAGSHSITAVYGGDSNYLGSTSPVLTQTVNRATTTVTVKSSLNPSNYGQVVKFTAKVSPSKATGSVAFQDAGITIGTGTLTSGTAPFSTKALAVGSHSITAVYSSDPNYLGSTSPVLTQTVN